MTEQKIAERYARALLNLAREQKVEDDVHADIVGITRTLADSSDLQAFLQHPTLSLEQRRKGLEALFASRLFKQTYSFLLFLADRRRLALLAEICTAFEALHREAHSILQARVTSAQALTESQIDSLRAKLAERHDKTIELSTEVDAALIGGFAIQVKDIVHDSSVRGRLDNLRRSMCHA